MKRILCLLLAVFLLCGCTQFTNQTYTPTGDALIQDGDPIPTNPINSAVEDITLVYYPDKTMNPYASNDYTNRALFSLIYQGLFSYDRSYQVQPVLCKSYSVSRDMRTYVFYLEDATFSDGTPVTAEDVFASWKQAKSSSYYNGRFTHISSFAITEDGGLQMRTAIPMENLPLLLDIPIVPAAQVEADNPMGSGPYMLDTNGMHPLLRRTNWWSDAPISITSPAITLYQAKASNQALSQIADYFKFDGLDLVCVNPCADPYADYMCDYELWAMENGNFLYLACSSDSALTRSGLRKALTYGIDREELATSYYRNFGLPATLPASPRFPYYNQALANNYGYDPEKFAQAVEEAGMTDREITLLVNSQDSLRTQVAQAIAQMLEAGGLKVTVVKKSGSSYTSALRNRSSYDLYLGQTKLSPNMDLSAFFSSYGALNYGGISNVTAYSFAKAALANHGNYYTLHEAVMEDGLLCPILFQSFGVFATRGKASFLTPARDNIFYYSTGKTMADALID